MKPLGRKSVRFPSKRDVHPPKGWVNWWENEHPPKHGKAKERRDVERALRESLLGDG